MKVLHTIHAVGEYSGTTMHQQVHTFEHDDIVLAYEDINQMEEADRGKTLDKFTTINQFGIFTSCPCVAESYIILDESVRDAFHKEITQS